METSVYQRMRREWYNEQFLLKKNKRRRMWPSWRAVVQYILISECVGGAWKGYFDNFKGCIVFTRRLH